MESGNWNFKGPKIHPLAWFGRRSFVILIVALAVSIGFASMYADPNNSLFHNYVAKATPPCDVTTAHAIGAYCHDPTSLIWGTNPGDLSDWNSLLATWQPANICIGDISNAGNSCARLAANSTNTAVILSKSSIDFSKASAKTLVFNNNWANSISPLIPFHKEWGYFLTTNPALPTTANYNPINDPSVVFDTRVWCDSANGCMATTSNSTTRYQTEILMLNTIGKNDTIANELTGNCGGTLTGKASTAGSCFLVSNAVNISANNVGAFATDYLNFTGTTTATSCGTPGNVVTGGGCSFIINNAMTNNNNPTVLGDSTTQIPWLKFQSQQYFIGFYAIAGLSNWVYWSFNGQNFVGCCNMDSFTYNASPASATPPNIDTGGFFGPIIAALINLGIWLFNSFLSFIAFITPALQAALNFLVNILVTGLNGLGNALGLGNVGTDLQSLINSMITFFASGNFASIFTNLPASVSRLIDLLSIYFPWLPSALAIALNVATFAVNGIGFLITIFGFATQIGIGILATVLIVLFFVYTGDNALGGFLEFAQTSLWLIVGLGLKFLIMLTNFALDIVTNIVGIIPKPFIQMSTHALPRIPVVDVDATFIPPSGLMGQIRDGNLFAMALWISGLLFTALFESASPALPGSIGALTPSAANALKPLAGLVPLLEIMTVFVWIAAVFVVPIGWLANAMDMGQLPLSSGLGDRPVTHFGVRFRKAEKHGDLKSSIRGFRSAFKRRGRMTGPTPEEQATA